MSADKLQAVHEALADAFNESNPNATGIENSHPAFDHETLSEAFSEPHLNAANTEQSFARFDHAAFTGIFREPIQISPSEEPSPTSFDQAFAEILSERTPLSSNTQPSRPNFDQQAFSEILSNPPPISTNRKPPQPSFDHQALAEMLTELGADPIKPQMAPLSFDVESSSARFSGQIDHEEPAAKAFAVAPSTSAESAPPRRAKSLLAKLHHIFSTKEESRLSSVAKDTLPPSLSSQQHTPEPIKTAISTPAEDGLPQPVDPLPADLPLLSLGQGSPHLFGQPSTGKPVASDVAVTTDAATVWTLQATSLPSEISSSISTNTESSPPSFGRKSSTPTDAGRLGNVDQDVKAVAVAAPAKVENGRPQQARSLPLESVSPSSNNTEPPPSNFGKGHSSPSLPDRLDPKNVEPAEKPDLEWAQPPLTEPPPLNSPSTTPPLVLKAEPSHPILFGKPDNLAPSGETVRAAAPADTEHARSQLARSLLAELPPLISTDTESSPPNLETEPSPPTLSGRLKNKASEASVVAPTPQTNVENARPQRLSWLLAELAPMVSANQKPALVTPEDQQSTSIQLKDLELAANTISFVPQPNSASAVMQPLETKRLLSETLPSTDTEPLSFIFDNESSPISHAGQPDLREPAAEIVAAAPLSKAEDARTKQAGSLLADLPPSRSFFERKPSPAIFSGEVDKVGPALAEETVAAPPPPHAATARQTKSSPLTDLAALASTDTKSSFPSFEQDLPSSSLSGQPDNVGPPVNPVGAAGPTEAESPRPQHISSLLAALRVLTAKPSPPILQKEASRSTLASQPDNAGMSVKTVGHPTDAESALAPQTKSLLTEMPALVSTAAKLSAPIFEKEPSRPPTSGQPADVAPTAKATAVAPPTDTESAVTRAQQAKSLLAELDLNTAIHLRWVMRDIRSKRTKFSPVSANDLTALTDLGLVEIREGLPRLTGLGFLALD